MNGHRLTVIDRAALQRETLRVHLRYAQEVVEAFDFCPWARAAREAGRVRTVVVFGAAPELDPAADRIRALGQDAQLDIGLLVFPELELGRVAFQHFAASLRAQLEREEPHGRAFAIADFHPDAPPDLQSPERLVAFIRKSPDPTLQLVRRSALDAARLTPDSGTRFVDPARVAQLGEREGDVEPVHARIARNNHRTVERDFERVSAVLDDILRDRHRSYAALGVPLPPWSR